MWLKKLFIGAPATTDIDLELTNASPEHLELQREMGTVQHSLALLGLALSVLVAIAYMFFVSSQSVLERVARQDKINIIIPYYRDIYIDLLNAETGQRGFVLTGNPAYLQPYEGASARIDASLAKLQSQALIDREQDVTINQIIELKQRRFQLIDNIIKTRQEQGLDAAIAQVKTGQGKAAMDQLRVILDKRIATLREERSKLGAHIHTNITYSSYLLVGLCLMLILCVAMAVYRLLQLIRLNRALIKALHRDATHDALTGLPNRRYLFEWLTRSLSHAQRTGGNLSVFFVDLDGFKMVNDVFGHEAGDEMLKEVTRRFTSALRNTDLLARIGGDEFAVVVMQAMPDDDLSKLAQRMIGMLDGIILEKFPKAGISCSIGVAQFPDDGLSADRLLAVADDRMYKAKLEGKGRACFVGEHPPV